MVGRGRTERLLAQQRQLVAHPRRLLELQVPGVLEHLPLELLDALAEILLAQRLDRFIGYYEPYATSHDALDRDEAVQEETRNVARAVARVTAALRAGELDDAIAARPAPRPK